MDLDEHEKAREKLRAELVAAAKALPGLEAKAEKARAALKAKQEEARERIKALEQEVKDERSKHEGLFVQLRAASDARSRLFGEFVDRKLLQARDRAQNALNKQRRELNKRLGRYEVAKLDLQRLRKTLKPEALEEWGRKIALEEAEIALQQASVDALQASFDEAQEAVEASYKAVLRGPAKV